MAVQHKDWYVWGSGGCIKKHKPTPVKKVPNRGTSMLKKILDYKNKRSELSDQMADLNKQMSDLENEL